MTEGGQPSQAEDVQITIRINDPEHPLCGDARRDDGTPQVFAGWLGLLSILRHILEPEAPTELTGGASRQLNSGTQIDPVQDV